MNRICPGSVEAGRPPSLPLGPLTAVVACFLVALEPVPNWLEMYHFLQGGRAGVRASADHPLRPAGSQDPRDHLRRHRSLQQGHVTGDCVSANLGKKSLCVILAFPGVCQVVVSPVLPRGGPCPARGVFRLELPSQAPWSFADEQRSEVPRLPGFLAAAGVAVTAA